MTKKFDPTKPVQTRDGRKARVVCTDALSQGSTGILALVRTAEDDEDPYWYESDGCYLEFGERDVDLVNVPEEREKWVVFWRTQPATVTDLPECYQNDKRVWAIVRITATEGEGLE